MIRATDTSAAHQSIPQGFPTANSQAAHSSISTLHPAVIPLPVGTVEETHGSHSIEHLEQLTAKELSDGIAQSPASPKAKSARVIRSSESWNDDPLLIGNSEPMRELLGQIKAVARWSSSVIIEGETGSGKEVVAHAIHRNSIRSEKDFLTFNCSCFAEHLSISQIVGHEEGAFTGARRTLGLFEIANGGTLFLDEIDLLPDFAQQQLLRMLEDKPFQKLGGSKHIVTNVRVLCASNRDLSELVTQGRFREDLFQRLNVRTIQVPPLRERIEDIPDLVKFLIGTYHEELKRVTGSAHVEVLDRALMKLQRYNWPGNVRELKHVLEAAFHTMKNDPNVITAADVRLTENQSYTPTARKRTLRADDLIEAREISEADIISSALVEHGYHRERTANALGINRTTLYKKMCKYGLLTKNSSTTVQADPEEAKG